MSSVTEIVVEEPFEGEPKKFTRLERMLLFAVVTECERCIQTEGADCFGSERSVDCPFYDFRQEYNVDDIESWKEMVK